MFYDSSWKFGRDGQLHQDAREVARNSRNRDMGVFSNRAKVDAYFTVFAVLVALGLVVLSCVR